MAQLLGQVFNQLIFKIDNNFAVRFKAGVQFILCPCYTLDVAKPLQVCLLYIVYTGNIRIGNFC